MQNQLLLKQIQINMKKWHAQQLHMTDCWVAAWVYDRKVLRSFLFYLFVFMCVHESTFIVFLF